MKGARSEYKYKYNGAVSSICNMYSNIIATYIIVRFMSKFGFKNIAISILVVRKWLVFLPHLFGYFKQQGGAEIPKITQGRKTGSYFITWIE
jgi:hypothetical protein